MVGAFVLPYLPSSYAEVRPSLWAAAMISKVRERETNWVFLAPVTNLRLTEEVNYELQTNSVTLVDADHLPGRRRRLGFPERISEIRDRLFDLDKHFFEGVDTFAVVEKGGHHEEIEEEVLQQIRDALSIVSLSLLGFASRRSPSRPVLADEKPTAGHRYLSVDSVDGGLASRSRTFDRVGPLTTTANWVQFQNEVFFSDLLDILAGEADIRSSWREDLGRAAILAGQSQATLDLPQAFLLNMIVVEVLLTRRTQESGKKSDTLPKRAEAFLGWSGWWEEEGYEESIRTAWDKRCDLVHNGERGRIGLEDLFFTDVLVLNLLMNIVEEIDRFDSKDAIVEFSERLECQKKLDIDYQVRPRSLRFLRRTYSDKDLEDTLYHR